MRKILFAIAACAMLLTTSMASASKITQFYVFDHPGASQSPPGYGLRADNLFTTIGGTGGITTFSFNVFNDTILTVTETESGGGGLDITINISGTLYGGVKDGTGYGFGEGAYALDFTYSMNVMQQGTGWIVSPQDEMNNGTLTALDDNAGVAAGTQFSFKDKHDKNDNSFLFLQDDHRLGGHPDFFGEGYWVGRGWLDFGELAGLQDFLFIAVLIPLPAPVWMGLAGLAGVVVLRRRLLPA